METIKLAVTDPIVLCHLLFQENSLPSEMITFDFQQGIKTVQLCGIGLKIADATHCKMTVVYQRPV